MAAVSGHPDVPTAGDSDYELLINIMRFSAFEDKDIETRDLVRVLEIIFSKRENLNLLLKDITSLRFRGDNF